jgi:hypothetical protein
VRLHLGDLGAVDHIEIHAKLITIDLFVCDRRIEDRLGAIESQIASAPHHGRDAGFSHERVMLGDASLDQRLEAHRRARDAMGR